MKTMFERLLELNHLIAFYLLKHCLAIKKITYFLRTHSLLGLKVEIQKFDYQIKSILEKVININLTENQWAIASLPIRSHGHGIRKASDVTMPAFLSVVNFVFDLVKMTLRNYMDEPNIADYTENLSIWLSMNDNELPGERMYQSNLNQINRIQNSLSPLSDKDKARMHASIFKECGAWLTALPSRSIGTLLDILQ